MKGNKEKVEKEWNCNSEDITKCHFSEDMFEGVKCCMFFDGYDRGLDQFRPQNIKKCDQKIFSIIKGKAHQIFDEQKGKCGQSISLGKMQKKIRSLKLNATSETRVPSVGLSNKPIVYIHYLLSFLLIVNLFEALF
jgi:hypothetical protein